MLKTIKTIYCTLLEQQLMFKEPIRYPDNVTLNSRYGVSVNESDGCKMSISYFGVGIHPQYTNTQFHATTDRDMYLPTPLLAVKKSIGLTPIEDDTYRIKIEKIVNNEAYIFCFLKKITNMDYDNNVYELEYDKVSSGYGLKTYTPPPEFTSNPITKNCDDINKPSKFYGVSSKYSITLSSAELMEVRKASALYYNQLPKGQTDAIYEAGFYAGIEGLSGKSKELSNCVVCLLSPLEQHNFKEDGSLNLIVNYGSFNPHV